MQDCFRLHPDIYGSELEEDEIDAQLDEHIASEVASEASSPTSSETSPETSPVQQEREKRILKSTAPGQAESQNQGEPVSRVRGQERDTAAKGEDKVDATSETRKK